MKVTRTIYASTAPALLPICKVAGLMRADIWRRYGALGTHATSAGDIRKGFSGLYGHLHFDGTIRAETSKDIINDIFAYRAAAVDKVKSAIAKRTNDEKERKRLYSLLRRGEWLDDPFLHRQMRKHFRHGVSKTSNQFIVRSDKFTSEIINGRLVVTIRIAPKYGSNITLVTTTSGKNVDLAGSNLRIIVKGDITEIHYAMDKPAGRPHGAATIGVDKGYTEAFADSDGGFHGLGFGAELRTFSDAAHKTGKARNRLHALEKKHRAAGRTAKADRILKNNLGRKKIEARRAKTQRRLRTIAFKAAHAIVDKAASVGAEDLTSPIAKKQPWKGYNRRMGFWAKGVLAEALESVTEQRGACLVHVASAYTSQIDSHTGLLEGKRVGDRFYHANGEVSQADVNAALNVKARMTDPDIGRYTPYREIKRILLSRSPAQLSVNWAELQAGYPAYQPAADKFYNAHICARL
jgi:transposase